MSLLVFDVDPVRQQDLAPEDYRLPNLKAREIHCISVRGLEVRQFFPLLVSHILIVVQVEVELRRLLLKVRSHAWVAGFNLCSDNSSLNLSTAATRHNPLQHAFRTLGLR